MKDKFATQLEAISRLEKYKVGALFMEPGTGKTRTCVELVNGVSMIDHVFFIAPLRTIYPPNGVLGVIDEVTRWGGFKSPVTYVGVESIGQSDRMYMDLLFKIKSCNNPFVVVDESIKIKNISSKRSQRVLRIGELADYKLVMNGTPVTRDLLDYWAQFQFLSPLILNMNINQFKDTFCKYTTITKRNGYKTYKKEFITGYENIDHLHELTKRYVYECDLNLSLTQNFHKKTYTISEEERIEYNRIKALFLSDKMLEWKQNNVFMAMTQKMQHAYCCSDDKIRAVKDILEKENESKCLIFCKYISSKEKVKSLFPKSTVLSYQTSSIGLNLQEYNITIYFDKIWDYYLRRQSLNRTYRAGQKLDCHYYDLDGDVGLENLIDKNVFKKIDMVEYLKSKTKEEIISEL